VTIIFIRSAKLPVRQVLDSITPWFPRLHALVVGPGMGRDPAILAVVKELILTGKQQNKNLVIDAVRAILTSCWPGDGCSRSSVYVVTYVTKLTSVSGNAHGWLCYQL